VIIQAGRHEGARGITEFFLPGQTRDLNLDMVDGRGNKSPSVAAE
jgi:type IV secretion system protein VirB11